VRTGGSGQLAVEIENGAPADLFLGANEAWMDLLATQGRIDTTTRRVVATTRLVAVVPGGPGDPPLRKLPQSPSDLLDLDRIAIGDTESVPAGIYTRQAFEHLGLWDGLEPKLIQTHDVRAALALAERGEVDAAVVYAPDAAISDRVHTVFAFPDTAHNPVRYTGAVIRDAPHTHAASRFLNFLTAGAGRRILASHGFTPRSEP
jgi:molybdate transport system substrate-binding protein